MTFDGVSVPTRSFEGQVPCPVYFCVLNSGPAGTLELSFCHLWFAVGKSDSSGLRPSGFFDFPRFFPPIEFTARWDQSESRFPGFPTIISLHKILYAFSELIQFRT